MRFIFILLLTALHILHPQVGLAHAGPKAEGIETHRSNQVETQGAVACWLNGPAISHAHPQPHNGISGKLAVQWPAPGMPWLAAFSQPVSNPVLWTRPLRHQLLFPQHYFW